MGVSRMGRTVPTERQRDDGLRHAVQGVALVKVWRAGARRKK
ncbi:hypothetical protein [Streptomyces sp. NPDC051677]